MSKNLDEDYAAAGFGNSLTPGKKPALVIIDFVDAYLNPTSPLYAGVEKALESAEKILNAARSANLPIIFTNVEFTPGGKDGGVFFKKVGALKNFEKGNALGAFPKNVAPKGNEIVVTKQYASAFFGTSLASTLTAAGVDTLLITGVSTSGCVRATTVDAVQHGFIPLVIRDAVGDRDERPHEANLFDMQAKYAEVISQEDALKYISTIISS